VPRQVHVFDPPERFVAGTVGQPGDRTFYLQASADGQSIITTLETLLPDGGPLTLALDIWDRGRALHYGWYGVELGAGTGIQTTTFNLDVARGEAHASANDGTALPLGAQFVGLQAGDYSARLQVSAGAAALAGSGDLFTFHVGEDQSISDLRQGHHFRHGALQTAGVRFKPKSVVNAAHRQAEQIAANACCMVV